MLFIKLSMSIMPAGIYKHVQKYKEYSLLVDVYSFYYYFVHFSRKWFVTIVFISKCLIFWKLFFDAFCSRFQSDKHLFNIEKRSYFSVFKSCLFSWCVLIDLLLWNWLVSICLKMVLKLFNHFSSRQSFITSMFWSVIKFFSFIIFNLCISFKTWVLFGKNFIIWMVFSCNFSIFWIQCLVIVPII